MLEDEFGQPAGVRPGPGLAAGEDPSMAQQKRLQMLALRAQILHRCLPRPHQLAHGLVPWIRHPDGGQLAGPVQRGQGQGIAPVGLDPFAWALGDERRGDHRTIMPEGADLALQAIAGWTRLVAEQQLAVPARQLVDQTSDRFWAVVDVTEETDLALA